MRRFCVPLLALLLLCATLSPVSGGPSRGSSGNSFTLHIGRLSMRNVSNLLELLLGRIKTADVVMENLVIEVPQRGGTLNIAVERATAPYAEMKVSLLQVLALSITHLSDLIPLLLGKTVVWEDVTIVASYLYGEDLQLSNQRMWVGEPWGSKITAENMSLSSLLVKDTLKENSSDPKRFAIESSGVVMDNFEQSMDGRRIIAPKAVSPGRLYMEATSVFSPRVSMSVMEITEQTRSAPHRVRASSVVMEEPVIWAVSMDLSSLEFPNGMVIG